MHPSLYPRGNSFCSSKVLKSIKTLRFSPGKVVEALKCVVVSYGKKVGYAVTKEL